MIDKFLNMAAMKYDKGGSNLTRDEEFKQNLNGQYIGTAKYDGEWAMFIRGVGDEIYVKGRGISVKTKAYTQNGDKVPHLLEEMKNWPENTVVLGELCFGSQLEKNNEVGSILRCLPAKAIQRQEKGRKLIGVLFDCLMYNGRDLSDSAYWVRLEELQLFRDFYAYSTDLFRLTEIFDEPNLEARAFQIIANGGEGMVIQRKDNPYYAGSRKSGKTLKIKPELEDFELVVLDTIEPIKHYQGKQLDSWKYMIDGVAVTKPYFFKWKMGVVVKYKDTTCEVVSGFSDDDRAWLATAEAQELIKKGGLHLTVKAMEESALGKLRHPVAAGLRSDLYE